MAYQTNRLAKEHPVMAKNRSWYPWQPDTDSPLHPVLRQVHDDRTLGERVADRIASFGGSWPFIFIFIALIVGWALLNAVVLGQLLHHRQFDPYPFIALNLVLSATAGLQAPVIMMSQNRATKRDEVLATHHYEETRKIDELLRTNTDLTEKVHRLSEQIHTLTSEVRQRVVGSAP
jgi:uncharacterized membrane protein